MAWKVSEDGNLVVVDGNPVWIGESGDEMAFDAKANIIAAATAKREAAEARTKLKEAETKLSAYSGIEDPKAALEALKFATSMDGKKAMDDEAIKKIVESSVKPWQDKATELETVAEQFKTALYSEKVSKQFATSKFLNDKTILTPDAAEAMFGKFFKMDDGGKVVAVDASGNSIYSTTKAGEVADFEEAISTIFSTYQNKDSYLKASGQSGTGAIQNNGSGGKLNVQFANMSPTERLTAARAAGITT